jgi:hypothetical protein
MGGAVTPSCKKDERRDAVRRTEGRNGLDYVEVSADQLTLFVYFLGKLPPELAVNQPGIEHYLKIEGGQRVTDIGIADIDPKVNPYPDQDDYLEVKLDRYGDFSTYAVRLVGVENIDPRYARAEFTFKIDCGATLDCAPDCACEPEVFPEPEINYLAKDYQSFRQVIRDRLATLMPDWTERHAADLGVTLVELLSYAGDYLSYYQDAVATEAYLDTARQRISVRRHGRLVDFELHEGCNARSWVSLETENLTLDDPTDIAFITGLNKGLTLPQNVLNWKALREVPATAYEVFEPVDRVTPIKLYEAHNEIRFHTWGDTACCLERGSTSATLVDAWLTSAANSPQSKKKSKPKKQEAYGQYAESASVKERALKLKPGDVLIFEEVVGPITGLAADADPARRHAVRLTKVTQGEDPLLLTKDDQPTPYVRIEWGNEDALPFTLCISAIGAAPGCNYLENISVARGNLVLVDHGKTVGPEDLGAVLELDTDATCECAEVPGDVLVQPARFKAKLKLTPLTFRSDLSSDKFRTGSAAALLKQDVRKSKPQLWLRSEPGVSWKQYEDLAAWLKSKPGDGWDPQYDLIASRAADVHYAVEIDNDGIAHLRFGDGDLGRQPPLGSRFTAAYRVGNGVAGNVGADSISRLVLNKESLDGIFVTVRNPLPAVGGTNPEPVSEAKLFAPRMFRKEIQRAITAADYQEIAQRNYNLQRANAALVWTGSWYEADVSVDPLGREEVSDSFRKGLAHYLEKFRRMGHDLHISQAKYVPLRLALDVCVLPHYQQGHVKRALLDVFSNRVLKGGRLGFFHPDKLTFGDGIYLSQINSAGQAVAGVECVRVAEFRRLFDKSNHEIENGVLPLRTSEIAQLDNDPNYPEHGELEIHLAGGR